MTSMSSIPKSSPVSSEQNQRKSIFYVPLFESFDNYLPLSPDEKEALFTGQRTDIPVKPKRKNALHREKLQIAHHDSSLTESESDVSLLSPRRYRPLSSTSSNEVLPRLGQRDLTSPRLAAECEIHHSKPRLRSTTSYEPRYDIVYQPISASNRLNNSILNIPCKLPSKTHIRNSNLSLIADSPRLQTSNSEKSKTLPQNLNTPSPIRGSSSSTSIFKNPRITVTPESPNKSVGKISGLNFIRRSRSTKLSRSNSLLRSITVKNVEEGLEATSVITDIRDNYDDFINANGGEKEVIYALIKKNEEQVANSPLSIRRAYLDVDDEVAVHSGKI